MSYNDTHINSLMIAFCCDCIKRSHQNTKAIVNSGVASPSGAWGGPIWRPLLTKLFYFIMITGGILAPLNCQNGAL